MPDMGMIELLAMKKCNSKKQQRQRSKKNENRIFFVSTPFLEIHSKCLSVHEDGHAIRLLLYVNRVYRHGTILFPLFECISRKFGYRSIVVCAKSHEHERYDIGLDGGGPALDSGCIKIVKMIRMPNLARSKGENNEKERKN